MLQTRWRGPALSHCSQGGADNWLLILSRSTATCDPYLDPYFFAGPQAAVNGRMIWTKLDHVPWQESSSDPKMHRRPIRLIVRQLDMP